MELCTGNICRTNKLRIETKLNEISDTVRIYETSGDPSFTTNCPSLQAVSSYHNAISGLFCLSVIKGIGKKFDLKILHFIREFAFKWFL